MTMNFTPPNAADLSLEEKIGQLLVIGFPAGKAGLEHLKRAVDGFAAGNVILFSRNIGDPEEVHSLTTEIRRIVSSRKGIPPFISVDQEGGIVARLREGMTPLPGAMAQAAAVAGGKRGLVDIRALGRICGEELQALGINWNLAPVADVNVNAANPVIGVRSYGDEAEKVAELAAAFAAGLAEAGIMATAKHFPGHGDTEVDSHLGLPLIPHDLGRLEAVELLPFKRLIAEGVASVMTSHVRFPALEPDGLPATLSSRILTGLLREALGFKGIITTDCLEMKAIADNFPEAAVQSLKAGADIIDISHTYELQEAAAASIAKAVRKGDVDESRIDQSLSRIFAAKARLSPPPSTWAEATLSIARPASLALSRGISRDSLTLYSDGPGLPLAPASLYVDVLPQKLGGAEDPLAADSTRVSGAPPPPPRVSALLTARGIAGSEGGAGESVAGVGSGFDSLAVSIDPRGEEIAAVLRQAAGRDVAIGICDAGKHPGQVELVRALIASAARGGRRVGIVSMRGPYDLDLFPEYREMGKGALLCAFEYSPASAQSVADYLAGEIPARGGSPVKLSSATQPFGSSMSTAGTISAQLS
ncbi:MAG TPA: beta-N-acetylhexosaminidase [Rectinemataceae bacterium]|nr:beta-N-acetylhexosaminidase [Rectinemataceae bacterium]